MRTVRIVLVALLLGGVVRAPAVASAQGAGGAGAKADSAGMLRPGDLVRLRIWREPDLSGEFVVDQSGTVVFPRLGPRMVTNTTPAALQAALTAAYQEYLQNPSIEITLLRRVNVLGAVYKPGMYPVDPTMTVGDVLALAGGATPQGNANKITLLRRGERLSVSLAGDTRIADSPLRSGDQLFVPERSWISRNMYMIPVAITALVSLISVLK